MASAEFSQARRSVLDLAKGVCAFCALKDPGHLEVHHLNDNHADNRPGNLIPTCRMCHLIHHVGFVGVEEMGKLIHSEQPLPSHADFNVLLRALWVAEASQDPELSAGAQETLDELDAMADATLVALPGLTPLALGAQLRDMDADTYSRRGAFLSSVRILYDPNKFSADIDRWKASVSTDRWKSAALDMHQWLLEKDGAVGDLEPLQERVLSEERGFETGAAASF